MSGYIRTYKVLLHLYPTSYRQDYENEMVQLFTELLDETTNIPQRLTLLSNTVAETLKWATPELSAQAETTVATMPTFIKASTFISVLCVMPFVLITVYHLHTLYDHEAKPALLNLLVHMQALYAIILPAFGLVVVLSTIIWSLVHSERYWHVSWLVRLQTAWRNSLLILGCIGLLSLAILS